MKPVELSGLIKGLLVVIGIAMASGQMNEVRSWAVKEAFQNPVHSKKLHERKHPTPVFINFR
jgi:hypothetical protein